jgi:hypothetical protein
MCTPEGAHLEVTRDARSVLLLLSAFVYVRLAHGAREAVSRHKSRAATGMTTLWS